MSGSPGQRMVFWVTATQRLRAPAYGEAGGLQDAGPPLCQEDRRGPVTPVQLPEEQQLAEQGAQARLRRWWARQVQGYSLPTFQLG